MADEIHHMFTPEVVVTTDPDGGNPRFSVGRREMRRGNWSTPEVIAIAKLDGPGPLHWTDSYAQSWDERGDVDSEHPAAEAACAWLDQLIASGELALVRRRRRRTFRRPTERNT